MIYTEDDFIMASALQHYVFCPRQCALIHLEDAWRENALTARGRLFHRRVDSGARTKKRNEEIVARNVYFHSYELGVVGKADTIELRLNAEGKIASATPVEYKVGKPKNDISDKAQLAAQAMCLEEMLGIAVPTGAIFYGKTRERVAVQIDDALRNETRAIIDGVRTILKTKTTPKARYTKRCLRCSLIDVCLPNAIGERKIKKYLANLSEAT